MSKLYTKLLIILGIVLSPFAGIQIYGAARNKVYSNTYYGEMANKINLLKSTDDKKIIVIGGSSVAFGLRSDELEKATDYKVVNFGLYAGLGTKPMIDLSKNYINEGDIVILSPELSEQTYSLYTNYNMLHKCLESCYSETYHLPYKDHLNMIYNYFSFFWEREHANNIVLQHPYMKECFNSNGDIECEEATQNQFINLYDSNQLITPNEQLIDNDFIDYVNSFNKFIKKKNATLYFSFSPSNSLALVKDNIQEFEDVLESKLDCDLLGTVNSFTYNPLYFYDTNYHLNYNGSYNHTRQIALLLNEKLNKENTYIIPTRSEPAPKYTISNEDLINGLKLSLVDDNYYVKGVNDDIKQSTTYLEIPSTINDKIVIGITDAAFDGMINLDTIKIPNTVTSIEGSPFSNCPNLKSIYLLCDSVPSVSPVGLVDGANNNVKIYVPKSLYSAYTVGYAWISYKDKIKTIKEE